MKRALSIALACSIGCTSKDVVSPGALTALAQSTSADTIRLPTREGGAVEFGPNATLRIGARDTVEIPASSLYSNPWGLFQKDGTPIGSWDDVRSVEVEQLDGAATVAVSATAAIAIVALAALLKGSPSGSSGGPKGSSSGGGGGGGKAAPVRSAPNAPTSGSAIAADPDVAELVLRTAEAIASTTTTPTTVATTDEDEVATAVPLFSRGARRRANVRFLARLDGGACWPGAGTNGDCIVTGARAGLRLMDVFEVTGGVRVESNSTTNAPFATFGAMFHGESPAAHWFAIALGASIAFDGARAHVVPQFSVRFRPVRGLWLGLVPAEPVYATETGGWTMASGLELTGEL